MNKKSLKTDSAEIDKLKNDNSEKMNLENIKSGNQES